MRFAIVVLALCASVVFAAEIGSQVDSDFLAYDVSKRSSNDYTSKFLPIVLSNPEYASRIKACKSAAFKITSKYQFDCPLFCFDCFFQKKLYRHDPCTCQGSKVCQYNPFTKRLVKVKEDYCGNYQPYYRTDNICLDEKQFKLTKSSHPQLSDICDFQYEYYLNHKEEEGSGLTE